MLHDPKVNGIVANFRTSPTGRRRRALTESERKFRLLVENANDLISPWTRRAPTCASPAIETHLRLPRREVIGTSSVRFVFQRPARPDGQLREDGGRGVPRTCRARGVMKDGSVRYAPADPVTLRTSSGGIIGVPCRRRRAREAEKALKGANPAETPSNWPGRRIGTTTLNASALDRRDVSRPQIPKLPTIDRVPKHLKCCPPEDRQTIALAFQKYPRGKFLRPGTPICNVQRKPGAEYALRPGSP